MLPWCPLRAHRSRTWSKFSSCVRPPPWGPENRWNPGPLRGSHVRVLPLHVNHWPQGSLRESRNRGKKGKIWWDEGVNVRLRERRGRNRGTRGCGRERWIERERERERERVSLDIVFRQEYDWVTKGTVSGRGKTIEYNGSSEGQRGGSGDRGGWADVCVGVERQVTDGVYLCPAEIMGSPGRHKSFILSYFLAAMNNDSAVRVTRSHHWNLPGPLPVESGPNGVCFDGQYFTPGPPCATDIHKTFQQPFKCTETLKIITFPPLPLLTTASLTHRKQVSWVLLPKCCKRCSFFFRDVFVRLLPAGRTDTCINKPKPGNILRALYLC